MLSVSLSRCDIINDLYFDGRIVGRTIGVGYGDVEAFGDDIFAAPSRWVVVLSVST